MTPPDLARIAPTGTTSESARQLWVVAVLAVLGVLLVHWPTTLGVIDTWHNSVSYNHGYLVVPVSAWLLWRERGKFAGTDWRPWWPGLALLVLLGVLWFLGYASNIKSFRDLALVASIPATLITVLGRDFARRAAFPLAFLLFAWPFGEVFIPQLIDLTADFTVTALRLSGVPVFREGNNFVIPSGEWSVVQECSGVRYLIVSLFAGSLFAYLNFRSNRRRWVFVAMAVIVPIVANWLRAYLIVLLGHLSNNTIAVGVDHLIYGWVFFGVVMTALFYFGLRFMGDGHPEIAAPARSASPTSTPMRPVWISAAATAALSAVAPLAAFAIDAVDAAAHGTYEVALPPTLGAWVRAGDPASTWRPPFENPTARASALYRRENGTVDVHIARYASDSGATKLTTFDSSTMVDFDSAWRVQARRDIVVDAIAPGFKVVEREIGAHGVYILSWQWALIGGMEASGFVDAKVALTRARLSGRGTDSTGVALIAPIEGENVAAARAHLQEVARQLRASLGTMDTAGAKR